MIYGIDVSAYQPEFDFAAAGREGFDFAIIKATEGTTWRSACYHAQLRRARAAGLLVAAYHYVRGADVTGQLANVRAVVGTDTPVILDVEDGAGPIWSIRELNAALNRAGYRTPLIYLPRWYWRDRMGSPDLTGLPPNWHSEYPDNVVRRKEAFVDQRPNGPDLSPKFPRFGGIDTVVAQFSSSLAVANYPNGRIDGNAYRGTRQQFKALLEGLEEDDVTWLYEDVTSDVSGYKAKGYQWLTMTNLKAELAQAAAEQALAVGLEILAAVTENLEADEIRARLEARAFQGAEQGAERAVHMTVLPVLEQVLHEKLDDDHALARLIMDSFRDIVLASIPARTPRERN